MKRVVIVGGGVIGTACAHYLSEAGIPVTLLDRGTIGHACSRGNCGMVCPSHVLPLAGPGMIGKTLKTLIQKDSPLKVKFRFDPTLWGWLFRFARQCNHRDMMAAGTAIQALLNSARQLYNDLFRNPRLDAEWEERGILFVFQTAQEFEHYRHVDHLLREQFDMGAVPYAGAKLNELEPALKSGLAGGWHYELDAHLRPDKLMNSWQLWLQERGVEIREKCDFLGFERQNGIVRGVRTNQGSLECDQVIIATGAWTPQLNQHLGCSIPIQPGKGYSITMPRPGNCPKIPLIFEEHRVAVTPMQSGYRIGSTMEFAGFDETLNRDRLRLLTNGASHYLQEPVTAPVLDEWWGWRPMVFDGKPIIGHTPGLSNVLIAAGHGMLGLSMAPSTGKLVAELLTGNTPHVDPYPYRVGRF
jgi:D-amino-acid dehydrogenase